MIVTIAGKEYPDTKYIPFRIMRPTLNNLQSICMLTVGALSEQLPRESLALIIAADEVTKQKCPKHGAKRNDMLAAIVSWYGYVKHIKGVLAADSALQEPLNELLKLYAWVEPIQQAYIAKMTQEVIAK